MNIYLNTKSTKYNLRYILIGLFKNKSGLLKGGTTIKILFCVVVFKKFRGPKGDLKDADMQ